MHYCTVLHNSVYYAVLYSTGEGGEERHPGGEEKDGHGHESKIGQYCTVLYCIILYCIVLSTVVLYCIVLSIGSTVLFSVLLYLLAHHATRSGKQMNIRLGCCSQLI
jgi:hypothetical protein